MPPHPDEEISQREFVLRLRAAVDTAINYPSDINRTTAINLAVTHPKALRSSHARDGIGGRRWAWLNEAGVYPVGEAVEINGVSAVKGTYSPELKT